MIQQASKMIIIDDQKWDGLSKQTNYHKIFGGSQEKFWKKITVLTNQLEECVVWTFYKKHLKNMCVFFLNIFVI